VKYLGIRQGFLEIGDMLPSTEHHCEFDIASEFDSQITHTCVPLRLQIEFVIFYILVSFLRFQTPLDERVLRGRPVLAVENKQRILMVLRTQVFSIKRTLTK
jgi:hypothetical protein